MNFFFGILVLCCCIIGGLVCVYICINEEDLYIFLMIGYNKDICFGLDRGIFIIINLIFFLYLINDFDLNIGKFFIIVIFSFWW